MSDWTVYLTFIDGKSKKFWRAKTDGGDLHVNYGRIGSDGQTKIKELDSAAEAKAAMEKLAKQKRKKGYEDTEGGGSKEEESEAAPASLPKKSVKMTLTRDGRPVKLTLTSEGELVTTQVVETHADAESASAAYDRIVEALVGEGYKRDA